MSSFAPFSLKVPGSTANLGPGFDSIGLAVNRYLHVNVSPAEEWSIVLDDSFPSLSADYKENLLYIAAKKVAAQYNKDLPALKLETTSEIPFSRGLGSSAAAIVAGIELADIVLGLSLSKEEKSLIACQIEGHPDNTTASLCGGLNISSYTPENDLTTITSAAPKLDLIAMIPENHLKTSLSREVLPKELAFPVATRASSVSNVLVAALLQENWKVAGRMMEQDLLHQPYRAQLIPDLHKIIQFGKNVGVYGCALSGAGPTVMCFAPNGTGENIAPLIADVFPAYRYEILQAVSKGVTVNTKSIKN